MKRSLDVRSRGIGHGLIAVGALTAGCLLGLLGGATSAPEARGGEEGTRKQEEPDLHGAGRDLRTEVELLPNARRGSASLQVSIDNATKASVKLAHAVQVLDAQQHDVTPPILQDATVAQASGRTEAQPVKLALSALKDGYYEIMVQTIAESPEAEGKRYLSSHLYVALEAGDVRSTDFYEWYQKSGANVLKINEQRIGPPIKDMQAFAEQIVKGEL